MQLVGGKLFSHMQQMALLVIQEHIDIGIENTVDREKEDKRNGLQVAEESLNWEV